MKVVYNACFGGFSLSEAAIRRYAEIKGLTLHPEKTKFGHTNWWTTPKNEVPNLVDESSWRGTPIDQRRAHNEACAKHQINDRELARSDPVLVQVVEELGDKANGRHADLKIAEVEASQRYRIDEYDGSETVMTVDDYTWDVAS